MSSSPSQGSRKTQKRGSKEFSVLKKNVRDVHSGLRKHRRKTVKSSNNELRRPKLKGRSKKLRSEPKGRSSRYDDDKKEEIIARKKKRPNRMSGKIERPKLDNGTEIRCRDGSYTVESLLGSGGFGDVYKVRKEGTQERYALKTELNQLNGEKMDRLKLEVTIMTELASVSDPRNNNHFVLLIDKGKTNHFKLIVMQMVGPSIDDIRRRKLRGDFTKRTAMYISQETLEGIRDLHHVGFIHRDIKPQNFAIGIGKDEKTIFVLDLGIAHRYIDRRTGQHKAPRSKVRFLGTVRYASRNCHRSREQSRKDDLEAWMYMSVELYSVSALPWRRVCDKRKVIIEKDKFFLAPSESIYEKAPHGYMNISKYIDNLTYEEEPSYIIIQDALKNIFEKEQMSDDFELDWLTKSQHEHMKNSDDEVCAERKHRESVDPKNMIVSKDKNLEHSGENSQKSTIEAG